jgi:hypothetical protein
MRRRFPKNPPYPILQPRSSGLYPWSGPIPVVRVEGSNHEMGLQHGEQTRNQIQKAVRFAWATLPKQIKTTKSEILRDLSQYNEKIRDCHSGFCAEMEGIAEGADVSYDDIVLLNSQYNIVLMRGGEKALDALSCSAFASWGSGTRNGDLVAGHNDDGLRFTDQFLVLLDARPDEGHRFCVPLIPGYLGYHTIASEAGFCAFGNTLEIGPKPEVARIGVPMWVIFRYLGQYEDNVESALEFIGRADNGIVMSFLLVDRACNAAIVHLAPDKLSLVRPGKNYLVLTNHALVDEIKQHLVMRENPSSTHYRYESLRKAVEASLGRIDHRKAIEIMSTHFDASLGRDNPSGNTPCRHYEYEGKFSGTCRSAIIRLGRKRMKFLVSLGNPCTACWVEVNMKYPRMSRS